MTSIQGYNQKIEDIRSSEFPKLKDGVYLDHAGTTLYARSQIEAVQQDLLNNLYGNPHSRSVSSTLTTDSIDQIRYRVLQFVQASPDEYAVIFTPGCTGALKLLADCFDFGGRYSSLNQKTDASESLVRDIEVDSANLEPPKYQKNVPSGKNGCFCYFLDNHTSVQGMREVAASKGAEIICFEEADLMGVSGPEAEHQASDGEILACKRDPVKHTPSGYCLWALPAQSNFSGRKYPLHWLIKAKNQEFAVQKSFCGPWFTLLDSAAFVSTSPLDLSQYKPDFVTLSFYKIFGYPTGLGALIVHKDAVHTLTRTYFGGGTVAVSVAKSRFHIDTPNISARFEDGTVSFLDIIALRHGFDALERIPGGMAMVSEHTFSVARYFHHELVKMKHGNGNPLAKVYCDSDFNDISRQGPVVNHNLLRANGEFVGFAEVDKLAQLHNIHVRTGCFCNIGACQKHLPLTENQIRKNYDAGHVCGDNKDLVDGLPTGSIRVSFGYMSTLSDAQKCLQFIADCFLEGVENKPSYAEPHCKTAPIPASKTQDQVSTAGKNMDTSMEPVQSSEIPAGPDVISNGPTPRLPYMPEEGRPPVHLTNIFLFPVKSCAAFEVTEWEIGPTGFVFDRNWMIVNDSGTSLGQKREPKLCCLRPQIDLKQRTLTLNFPGVSPFTLSIDQSQTTVSQSSVCSSKVCGDRVSGTDCGDEVADWLSGTLGRPGCRLIRQVEDESRQSKLKDADKNDKSAVAPMALTNQSQFLLISRSSIRLLQDKIRENQEKFQDEQPIETENLIDRFRGNLVIEGGEGFAEESWTSATIGPVSLVSQGRCSRCQMISMNQRTGEKSNEPLRTLGSWRGGRIPFGIYLRWDVVKSASSSLKVGDAVSWL